MKILISGVAGFIGFHLAKKLLSQGHTIVGIDNLNTYYEVQLKIDRLKELGVEIKLEDLPLKKNIKKDNFSFHQIDLTDEQRLNELFSTSGINLVINLAAQAGVRYSIENPKAYINSNIVGFMNILECCKKYNIKELIYASSSSVYGNSDKSPFEEIDHVDNPISIYAATKKSNELMAHVYSYLFNIKTIGLRFFTVYGPWGRPDMAPFLFTKAILNNNPINVFNNGDLMRDFTFIDDVVGGIEAVIHKMDAFEKYEIFNIGNNKPVALKDFIDAVETSCGKEAIKVMFPMQEGDVYKTYASIDKLNQLTGYSPETNIREGINKFVSWYKEYYKIS
jgi:UDP-glucuronate 4-epimerase